MITMLILLLLLTKNMRKSFMLLRTAITITITIHRTFFTMTIACYDQKPPNDVCNDTLHNYSIAAAAATICITTLHYKVCLVMTDPPKVIFIQVQANGLQIGFQSCNPVIACPLTQ